MVATTKKKKSYSDLIYLVINCIILSWLSYKIPIKITCVSIAYSCCYLNLITPANDRHWWSKVARITIDTANGNQPREKKNQTNLNNGILIPAHRQKKKCRCIKCVMCTIGTSVTLSARYWHLNEQKMQSNSLVCWFIWTSYSGYSKVFGDLYGQHYYPIWCGVFCHFQFKFNEVKINVMRRSISNDFFFWCPNEKSRQRMFLFPFFPVTILFFFFFSKSSNAIL